MSSLEASSSSCKSMLIGYFRCKQKFNLFFIHFQKITEQTFLTKVMNRKLESLIKKTKYYSVLTP